MSLFTSYLLKFIEIFVINNNNLYNDSWLPHHKQDRLLKTLLRLVHHTRQDDQEDRESKVYDGSHRVCSFYHFSS